MAATTLESNYLADVVLQDQSKFQPDRHRLPDVVEEISGIATVFAHGSGKWAPSVALIEHLSSAQSEVARRKITEEDVQYEKFN